MSPERLLNRCADLAYLPPWSRFAPCWSSGDRVILLYHRVVETRAGADFIDRFGAPPITVAEMVGEIRRLRSLGAEFMTAEDFLARREPRVGRFAVLVTFDDGLADTYHVALPTLAREGVPALVFQIAQIIDSAELLWEHALYFAASTEDGGRVLRSALEPDFADAAGTMAAVLVERLRDRLTPARALEVVGTLNDALKGEAASMAAAARRLYPSATDIRQAVASGHEVGSHGWRHLRMSRLPATEQQVELEHSHERIAAASGRPPRHFSYPFSDYAPGIHAEALCRYEHVFTVAQRAAVDADAHARVWPRITWMGPFPYAARRERWLRTGRI